MRWRTDEQFRVLVKGVTDYAIYMLDTEGRVASWNDGAERIKGYAPEEIIGQHFSRFYAEEDRAAGLPGRSLQTAARDGRIEMEGWRVRKDGTRFMAHVVIDAIHDDDGRLVGFAKVTRDITERVAAQAELTAAREALFQAQKMEAIGQLTGGVAHDFNNLLMAILSSLELAQKRLPDNPNVSRLIDNAVLAAERGAVLTQRMLAFARRQELKRESIDLEQLVTGMVGLLERTLGASIDIVRDFPAGLPPVDSDPAQLETALLNLAVNARDAMPDGGRITIGARAEDIVEGREPDLKAGAYVCLTVTDTGEGMDAATLQRATEPFFTTKGVGKGTGLGLSMIHGLVTQSGGGLWIESAPGVGSTVELWLPVAQEAPTTVKTPRAPPPEASRRLTVLAVDDDELVLLNTIAMLEDLGHTAIGANSAEEALHRLEENPVDLVVTDQAMPRMTGVQLARVIAERRPGLRVVLATGYADLPEGAARNLERLAKPFGQRELAHVIESGRAPER